MTCLSSTLKWSEKHTSNSPCLSLIPFILVNGLIFGVHVRAVCMCVCVYECAYAGDYNSQCKIDNGEYVLPLYLNIYRLSMRVTKQSTKISFSIQMVINIQMSDNYDFSSFYYFFPLIIPHSFSLSFASISLFLTLTFIFDNTPTDDH